MRKIVNLLLVSFVVFSCTSEESEKNIYALLASKNAELVEESYFNASTKTDANNVQSVTKSIISLLIGIAIDKGHIANENTPIFQFFPEHASLFTGNKKKITIKHLLNHTSGLEWEGFLEHEAYLNSTSPTKYILEKTAKDIPGEVYNYNSAGTHLLSTILSRGTNKTSLDFAKQVLFDPLEITEVHWKKLNDGAYDGAGFGLSLKPIDLIKIGELVLNKGQKNEQQIVSQQWITKLFDATQKKETKWGMRNSTHGYGWYLKTYNDSEILYAMGYGGQFIFIVPANNLVLVSSHNSDTPNGLDQQIDFISETLPPLLKKYSD